MMRTLNTTTKQVSLVAKPATSLRWFGKILVKSVVLLSAAIHLVFSWLANMPITVVTLLGPSSKMF